MNAPEILFGLEFYYGAFVDLLPEGQTAMGEVMIPRRARRDYAEEHGIHGAAWERFNTLITGLNSEYLKYRDKKRPNSDKDKIGGSGGQAVQ